MGNIMAHCSWFGGDRNVKLSLGSAVSTQHGRAHCVLPLLRSACCAGEGQSQLPFYERFQTGWLQRNLENACAV